MMRPAALLLALSLAFGVASAKEAEPLAEDPAVEQRLNRLAEEIRNGSSRLVEIVTAMKAYAYLGQAPLQDWQRIMERTGFYAGQPDDIGYPEWRNFLVKLLGTEKLAAGEDSLGKLLLIAGGDLVLSEELLP